jgi:hypothetical protein
MTASLLRCAVIDMPTLEAHSVLQTSLDATVKENLIAPRLRFQVRQEPVKRVIGVKQVRRTWCCFSTHILTRSCPTSA